MPNSEAAVMTMAKPATGGRSWAGIGAMVGPMDRRRLEPGWRPAGPATSDGSPGVGRLGGALDGDFRPGPRIRAGRRLGLGRQLLRSGRFVAGPTQADRGERNPDLAEDFD